MKRHLWIPFVALACMLAGCGRQPWVGEWQGQKKIDDVVMDIDLTLRSDGTFNMKQSATKDKITVKRTQAGYYRAENDTLIFTVSTMTINEKTVKTAEYQPPQPFTVKNDTLTYGERGGKIVMKRVKPAKK